MEFMQSRIRNHAYLWRLQHYARSLRDFRSPLGQRIPQPLLRKLVLRIEIGRAAKLRLRLHILAAGQIIAATLQMIEHQLLSNHGQRSYIFEILRNQPGRRIKFLKRFIEVISLLQLQCAREIDFRFFQIRF